MERKGERILILSVGSSADPVVNAIKFYQPDFIYFFCSGGSTGSANTIDAPGDPCGNKSKAKCPKCGNEFYTDDPKGKAIAIQAGLDKDKYEIITVVDPDDLNMCYNTLINLSRKIKEENKEAQIIANYTGGTKTMSAAIVLVAIMIQEWDLSLNKGPRLDLIKVKGGDYPVVINKWQIFIEQSLETVKGLLENYDYAQAEKVIREFLFLPLETSLQGKLSNIGRLCKAFDCWDKFDHYEALNLLQPFGKDFSKYIINLKNILGDKKASNYELVYDLINNAERKAKQKRYDDAIARLYRATELFAQIRMEEKIEGYKLGILNLSDIDESLRADYTKFATEEGKLLLGLREDYELLYKMNDPIGKEFKSNENSLIEALKYRNKSILAHGIVPLQERDYRIVSSRLKGFILRVAKNIGVNIELAQLPQAEIIK